MPKFNMFNFKDQYNKKFIYQTLNNNNTDHLCQFQIESSNAFQFMTEVVHLLKYLINEI